MKYKIFLLICLFGGLFFFSADSFAGIKGKSVRKPFKIVLTNMGGDYPSRILKRKNQHPYDIPESAFVRMLDNFVYKKRIMAGWEKKKRRVFPKKLEKYAAKYLREAFLKAKPTQKIRFVSYTSAGKTLCDIFIQREKIDWKFFSIHGKSRNQGMWMLVRGYQQKYYGTGGKLLSAQGLMGGGNYIDTGWIQMPLLQLIAEVKNEKKPYESNGGKKGLVSGKNKLEKLKTLTTLYHRKLITGKEYKTKVEELIRAKAGERLGLEEELVFFKILKDEKIISRDAYTNKRRMLLEK